jgi:hypothetical protein
MTAYYDFLFREYSQVEGRWLSPDPAGLAVVNPEDRRVGIGMLMWEICL